MKRRRHLRAAVALATLGVALPAAARRHRHGHPTAEAAPAPEPSEPAAAADEEVVEDVEITDAATVKEGDDWFGDAYPQIDRVVDLGTARPARQGAFNTLIQHRGSEGALRNPFYDLLGLDPGGIKVGLGVRYGVIDRLDVGVYRINGTIEAFDTYELNGRYQFLNQASHQVDLLVHAGISWFSAPGSQVVAPYLQLLVDRLVAGRALLGLGALFHARSTGPRKGTQDPSYSAALMAQADVRLSDNWSLAMEVTESVAGFHELYPVISLGPKVISNRHTFAFILSNSQYVDAAGIVANTWRIAPLDWVLGFHITREI